MPDAIKTIAIISRAEFLLPNLGSLILGLAWGANPPLSLIDAIVLLALSFSIINLSSTIGAQVNTIADYQFDLKDPRKKELVQALDSFGHNKTKKIIIIELILTLALVSSLTVLQENLILLLLWIIGISLGIMYSASPVRLKSRSWISPIAQIFVLAVFPVLFSYFAFTFEINTFFLLSLVGLTFSVYAVIIPTEIRDYFVDKAMKIETFTVSLGLSKASLLGIVLLSLGSLLFGTALILEWFSNGMQILSMFLIAMPLVVLFVLGKLVKLYSLSKDYETSTDNSISSLEKRIVNLSSDNPKWIMLVTQTYSILSIILLISKFIF